MKKDMKKWKNREKIKKLIYGSSEVDESFSLSDEKTAKNFLKRYSEAIRPFMERERDMNLEYMVRKEISC